ncbi:hypothetical protein [Capnocytophaga gingivalis]|jgi:hypothetical protein|uniref:Lipoprotein n=1 Tax=Capnocytophaga gingivalis TaxID=1017 RepID=A0ABU5Y7Z7_9FLAO|nr:hypothetical protein [Capnocytophaga gingivalis]MEB3040069.1 hypothetical protein [Capnocytophaga gingivalis]
MRKYIILLAAFLSLTACSDGKLTPSQAKDLVEESLEGKPLYETAYITLGEVKLRTQKDGEKIKQIKRLEDEDYLSLEEIKMKKKWLSNDSVWVVNIKCTDKALPYIIELKETRAKVKTLEYTLSDEVTVEQKGEKTATITATLLKKETPFSFLNKKAGGQDFIQKKYKAKYREKEGWTLSK